MNELKHNLGINTKIPKYMFIIKDNNYKDDIVFSYKDIYVAWLIVKFIGFILYPITYFIMKNKEVK
jgi:hypothetical protein